MKKNSIIFLLISAFILVVCYILFSIYHNSVTTTVPDTLTIQVSSIEASFDTKTIANLKTRQTVEPQYELVASSPTASAPANPLPSAKPSPVAPTPIQSGPTPTQSGPTPTIQP